MKLSKKSTTTTPIVDKKICFKFSSFIFSSYSITTTSISSPKKELISSIDSKNMSEIKSFLLKRKSCKIKSMVFFLCLKNA